jgi:hypothetical protein
MKRWLLPAASAAVSIAWAGQASALELGTPEQSHPFHSAQNFYLELRISPYYPEIDSESDLHGKTPFADSFGTSPRVYFGLEFDWQIYRIPGVGTIGPGASVGTVSMSRPAVTISGRPSGDTYSLNIYPFALSAVFRADTFWRTWGFPLVPYGKLGLGYGIWRASNTGGTSQAADGVSGKGSSWGTNIALGAAFALDALDPSASRNMDNATGINNTYAYVEYYWLTLDGIAQSHALYVGSNSWTAGIAFEF